MPSACSYKKRALWPFALLLAHVPLASAQPEAPPAEGPPSAPEPPPPATPEPPRAPEPPQPAEVAEDAPLVVANEEEQEEEVEGGHGLRDAGHLVELNTKTRAADTETRLTETERLTLRRSRTRGVGAPPHTRAGLSLSGGSVATPGIDQGWYGRLDASSISGKRSGAFGGFYGANVGFEYWTATGGSGGGMPAAFSFGALGPASLFGFDLGFEVLIFDDRDDDFGFGIYSPFARAKLGVDVGAILLLADSQIQYRWQWGADDYTDYRLGLSLVLLTEPPPPPPPPKKPAAQIAAPR